MRKKIIGLLIIVISFSSFSMERKILKSENFNVFYTQKYEAEAKKSLAILEFYREKILNLTGNRNNLARVNIVLEDTGMEANGFSNPDDNTIHIFTHNPLGFGDENWLETVLVHEYIHHLHLTNSGGVPEFLHKIFGNYLPFAELEFIPTRPNMVTPLWVIEGATVFGESNEISTYSGRLNKGYFDGYINEAATEKRLWSILEATYLNSYPYDSSYLYGGKFTEFLSQKYGKEKLSDFYSHFGKSPIWFLSPLFPAFGIDYSAKKVFGKSMATLWDDFRNENYAKGQRQPVLETIHEVKESMIKDAQVYEGELYIQQIRIVNTGINERFAFSEIVKKDSPVDVPIVNENTDITKMKITSGAVYYTVEEIKPGYDNTFDSGYGVFQILKKKVLETNNTQVLTKGNIRDFIVRENGNVILIEDFSEGFGSDVKEINASGTEKIVARLPFIISSIAEYHNKLYFNGKKEYGMQSIFRLEESGDYTAVVDTPFDEYNMRLINGNLVYTANYDDKVNVYRYNIEEEKVYKLTSGLYYEWGVFSSTGEEIYCKVPGVSGDKIVKVKALNEIFNLPVVQENRQKTNDYSQLTINTGGMSDWLKTLVPTYRRPIVSLPDRIYGVKATGTDALMENSYTLSIVYDAKNENWGYNGRLNKKFRYFDAGIEAGNLSGIVPDESYLAMYLTNHLFRSRENMVKALGLNNTIIFYDNMSQLEYRPGVYLYGVNRGIKFNGSVTIPMESSAFGSDNDRVGMYIKGGANIYNGIGALRGKGEFVYDEDNDETYTEDSTSEVFGSIRGYLSENGRKAFNSKNWTKLTMEQGILLTDKNMGLWNPNIMVQGLETALFIDTIIDNNNTDYYMYSGGVELKTNFHTMLMTFPMGIRWSINGDGEFVSSLFIE